MVESSQNTPNVVVVGGGITGLSAAWYLQEQTNHKLNITLIEASPLLGGKMQTSRIDQADGSFIVDAGPESFVTRKAEAYQLACELGLAEEIIDPGSETKNMFVLDGGVVKKIPLSPPAFIRSDLLSGRGKFRMAMEPFVPARRDDEDESLASFVSRRLGEEALEKMLGPVLAGIYNTDPHTQSIMTTSPVMREMEKEHGGLIKGALARMRKRKKQSGENQAKPPAFITFRSGAQTLVDALEEKLNCTLIKGVEAKKIERFENSYSVSLSTHAKIPADVVILAAPANVSGRLLADASPESADLLSKIDHFNIGTATMIFPSDSIKLDYQINGLMIPRREKRKIDAITWTSNKPINRGPQGFEILRVFFGGGDPELVNQPDEKILWEIRKELNELLGIEAQPAAYAIFTWPDSFPQAYVGHLELVDQIEAQLPQGIFTAGSSFRGIGVPDCIRQGRQAAERAINYLNLNFGGAIS